MCTYKNWRNGLSLSAIWCWGGCNPERFLLCSMPLPGAAILHSCQAHSSSVSSSWRCSSISIQTRMLHFCSWSLRQGMRDSMAFQQKRLWHHLLTRHYVVSSFYAPLVPTRTQKESQATCLSKTRQPKKQSWQRQYYSGFYQRSQFSVTGSCFIFQGIISKHKIVEAVESINLL